MPTNAPGVGSDDAEPRRSSSWLTWSSTTYSDSIDKALCLSQRPDAPPQGDAPRTLGAQSAAQGDYRLIHQLEWRKASAGVRGDIHTADSRGQENVGPWINRENLGWDTDVRPGGDSGPSGRSQLFPAWLLARREQLKKHLMRLVVRRRSWSEGWKGSKRLKKPRPHTWTHSALSEGRRNSEELSLGARRVLVQTVTRVRGRDTGLQNLCNDVDFWKKSY